jgi:hypothetical protein
VDDESKLTLHGLVQHYVTLHEDEKNRKLNDLLDALDFNQVRVEGGGGCWLWGTRWLWGMNGWGASASAVLLQVDGLVRRICANSLRCEGSIASTCAHAMFPTPPCRWSSL